MSLFKLESKEYKSLSSQLYEVEKKYLLLQEQIEILKRNHATLQGKLYKNLQEEQQEESEDEKLNIPIFLRK